MLTFGGGGAWRQYSYEERPFKSRLGVQPEHAVILLGAGASAAAGCPVMRGFVDRAMDFERLGKFTGNEIPDVRAALELYRCIRANFQITEEDAENVESLLSLTDLADNLILHPPLEQLRSPILADQLRSFIEAVITKSITIPSPTSPDWATGDNTARPYAQLVRTLAHLGDRVTVISLNYDCVLEYACHCMGLPFTYHRDLGDGLEILKLHGSSNWVRCRNAECAHEGRLTISEIQHHPSEDGADVGFIERTAPSCPTCGETLSPLIIAPTWAKSFDAQLMKTWSRAVEALASAEVLVTIGISLPESDAHLRELLHLGLSSAKLRQALTIVGSDEAAAARWSNLFRESWRDFRFESRLTGWQGMMDRAIKPALGVPEHFGGHLNKSMLPVSMDFQGMGEIEAQLAGATPNVAEVFWGDVLKKIRRGLEVGDDTNMQLLIDQGLAWLPNGPVMPVHGPEFPAVRARIQDEPRAT